jgi:hypothetical protein
LKAAGTGQYLFVAHPAVDSPEMRQLGNKDVSGEWLAKMRVVESLMFTDLRILNAYEENGITPIRYDQASKITDKLPPQSEWF